MTTGVERVYAVTGAASGMGRAVADRLRGEGHRVIGVDLRDTEVIADLSSAGGRSAAAAAVLALADGRLDGAVLAAGVGPRPGVHNVPTIMAVNYFGVVELAEAWRPAFAATGSAKVVVVGSNSATTMPMVPGRAVRALLRGDLSAAVRAVRIFRSAAPAMAYGASKIALMRWVRLSAVQQAWSGAGIRLNAIAPGAVDTPLLGEQLATPREAKAVTSFPVPVGGFGTTWQLAEWMRFMLSDAADFLCGSVIFVDGGSDAYFRATHWPRRVPTAGIPRYVHRLLVYRLRRARRSKSTAA
ncbi:SDR family oxidoreductase [Mycobacterium sp. shizuoka-1]|uniref:SDR family oxidoreductase n=1 Tax=Mycobacterium sp. shizuoka-1 TaxID=2039281 RepID=UPI000C067AF5|nr:SDR family oxidoreductase [Mycobacterium sp. shizuoka-1]GAY16808.1 NAD-dependent epimerase [Mycobacterium sp. shizuoka-1]